MVLEAVLAVVVLFVPGVVLLYLPEVKQWAPASGLEKVVLGSVIWSSFFVFVGYLVSIASNSAQEFFGIFAAFSGVILAYGAYDGIRRLRKIKLGIGRGSVETLPFAIIGFALSVLVLSLVLAHSLYQEYDGFNYYLALAKSILSTGGLQSDFYHQTVLTTSIEPAMPLMYAFAGFLGGGQSQVASASRLIPFAYVCLTCAAVYLAGKEITRKAVVGFASAILFLAIPVTSTLSSKFSLYLDLPFVFFVALILYSLVKVYSSGRENPAWWLVLGLSLAAALFERDITYFILLPVFAILALLFLNSRAGAVSARVTIGLTLLFAGAYNFFFVFDLYNSSQNLQSLSASELPVVVVMVLFFFLASTRFDGLKVPRRRAVLLAACPLALVAVLLFRNIFEASSITSNLPVSSPTFSEALLLLAQAGRITASPVNFVQPFRWDTLFYSLQLGALFLIPIAMGLVVVVWRAASKAAEIGERTRSFILLSSFLSMLLVWSWVFDSGFAGPEVRRLYYFSPFLAIFGGVGLVSIAERLEPASARLRIALYLAVTPAYFLYEEVGASWNLVKVSSVLSNLGDLTFSLLLGLSAILVLSLYPLHLFAGDAGQAAARKPVSITKVVAILLILVTSTFIAYNSEGILSKEAQTANVPPVGWENGLASVIQYLNSYQNNSYGIVSPGGLPLAYFTSHPTIDPTTYFGMESLLSINSTSGDLPSQLLSKGIHYLLMPTSTNSFYDFSTSLAQNFSVMNQAVIDQTPNLVLIQDFDKYQLYQVMTNQNLTGSYSFLTNFTGWTTLDARSRAASLPDGIRVNGGSPNNLTITSENQTSFWAPAKSVAGDHISIASDPSHKATGNSSLKISLSGTGGLVLDHYYGQPQNWSNYSVLSLYFSGANTSRSVSLTFHTNGWTDYFAKAFIDNFTGWKLMHFPLDSFATYGSPTWSNISFIEFLMGNRTATYWMEPPTLGGDRLGIVGTMPPVKSTGPTSYLVVSLEEQNTPGSLPPMLVVSTTNGTRVFDLQNGVNFVKIPSSFLTNGAKVELQELALSSKDSITFYYFGALKPPTG